MIEPKQNEPISALTHFVGTCLSIAGLVLLVVSASLNGGATHIVSYTIFGVTMIILYSMSTLYHFTCVTEIRTKRVLQILDHSAIYLLIAGTYTPVALIALPPWWGWTIFGLVWGSTIVGIILKATQIHIPGWLSASLYLLMGWMILIACVPLVQSLEPVALIWLVIGGIMYSVGVIFFVLDTFLPRTKWFGMHEVFHLFVMLGSFSHFWMLFRYLVHMQ